jgi:hypothetical protein
MPVVFRWTLGRVRLCYGKISGGTPSVQQSASESSASPSVGAIGMPVWWGDRRRVLDIPREWSTETQSHHVNGATK